MTATSTFAPLRQITRVDSLDTDALWSYVTLDTTASPTKSNAVPNNAPTEALVLRSHCVGLLDLPVEIRQMIYEALFYDTPQQMQTSGPLRDIMPVPPPISRVCQSMRQEVLEIWYHFGFFPLLFKTTGWFDSAIGICGTPSYDIQSVIPASIYPKLRTLVIFVEGAPLDCYQIALDAKHNSYSIRLHSAPRRAYLEGPIVGRFLVNRVSELGSRRLMQRFDKAMAEIIARCGGVGNITLDDYVHLTPQSSWKFWEDMPNDDPESDG